jgi:GMP synthase (glutamine-hydrolysing)
MFERLGLGSRVHFTDASGTFLAALDGVVDPEQKRRIIGDTFVRVFQQQARALGIEHHLLGQGTIYPDTIETGGTRRADRIKTHHNRVPIIEQLIAAGDVIEPLAELYKVEVRELGKTLGVPDQMLRRHPFPGPGLGIRLLCSDGTPDRANFDAITPQVDAIARRFGLAALPLPLRSVGVKADLRAYEHPVLLHGAVPWRALIDAVSLLTSEVPGVNRCVWHLGHAAPRATRPVRATVTRARLDLLREVDHLVMEGLERHGIYDDVWQCPTVLVPLALDDRPGELVVLRPVRSQRAMTAAPVELPTALLAELREGILALSGVSGLGLDVTSKPPGTIEWE